jgi:NADH-quinone oxidoreductase subunit N
MIEISSTPLVIIAILGVAGVILPVINVIRKEKGSNSFYAVIAFAALIISIGYVGYQFLNDNVLPSALFSEDVIVDDAFGGFFAIAMLIVAIFTTVGSFNYMRKQNYPAMSIPTYALVGFIKRNPQSNEAALKYFLFGALSSAIIVYGISITYGITGSTNYQLECLSQDLDLKWDWCLSISGYQIPMKGLHQPLPHY